MGMERMTVGLFEVTYDGSSVVTLRATASDPVGWVDLLGEALAFRGHFTQSKPGSDWGCDGVGHEVQKRLLEVVVRRSGVGPMHFHRGVANYRWKLQKAS